MNKKRREIETIIYTTFNILDPSGYNTKKYKELFKGMSDDKFDIWMKKFFASESDHFYLEITPFEDDEVSFDAIQKAADYLEVPLNETMFMPFQNPDGDPIATIDPVPVGYLHSKRLQQILSKKNSFSHSIDMRNQKTGQLMGEDKGGRLSDTENFALAAINAPMAQREYLGPKADDMKMKQAMLKDIANTGHVQMKNLPSRPENKVSLNTLDVYLTGGSLVNDLVTPGLMFKKTLDESKKDDLLSQKYK